MKWPLVTRSTHEAALREVGRLKDNPVALEALTALANAIAEDEFRRATDEGRAMVRAYAVDANYNLYATSDGMLRPKVNATLQHIIGAFAPGRRGSL